ncbi:MAG TPA: glycosyltransferase [Vitreimonas sp.]|uniref:glycosyltransferase n=1 Tax=Vitreimonas sp. TaxID=3069702 RepID=UPI002D62B112|nr:glycosyltransferase [Vitreimonas sp.]HYD86796.1 glycosyltransferase [Vitreimonas sp.]
MKICDITMAYNAKSGGIKTYIDEKRRFLRDHTDHEHLLIIPGSRDRIRRSGRSTTITLRGPLLPGQDQYRAFLSPVKIRKALMQEQPDIVELGSYYTEPWAAFAYRRRRRDAGLDCKLAAYFHTDVAEAYVGAPLRTAAQTWLEELSEALANSVERIADVAASGAERYIRYVFNHCDVTMAASSEQADRLCEYGVDGTHVVPMGVDLKLFSPRRRSQAVREGNGARPGELVLIYAGRLSTEKRVLTLIEAVRKLPRELKAQLWMLGDGPLREDVEAEAAKTPAIRLLKYEGERARFAATLASADIYVTAGPFETFALSVIEAQACGLPVVGVDAGALRERVAPGLGYLGPVDDAGSMAANIARAAAEHAAIARRARAHVEEHFAWPRAFAKLLRCYDLPARVEIAPPPAAREPAVLAAE